MYRSFSESEKKDIKRGCLEWPHFKIIEDILENRKQNSIVVDLGIASWKWYINPRASLCEEYIGMDLNPSVKENLKNYRSENKIHYKADFIFSDALHLPFRDNSIDIVLACGLFGWFIVEGEGRSYPGKLFLNGARKVAEESYRVLKNDGLFVVSNSIVRQPVSAMEKIIGNYFEMEIEKGRKRYLMKCSKTCGS